MIKRLVPRGVALRRLLLVLACGLIGTALAALFVAQSPPVYRSSATVMVASVTRTDGPGDVAANPLNETNDAQQKVLTLAQLATSDVVLERAIATIGLDRTAEGLRASVSAEALPQTVLVEITASDTDRQRAREIANTIALELGSYVEELNEQNPGSAATTSAQLVDPAPMPGQPAAPQPAIMLALGLFAGLSGGLVLTAALARRDDALRNEAAVEQATGLPSLGSVPRVKGRHLTPLTIAAHLRTAQSFKGIRNILLQRLPEEGSHVVVVLSSEPEDGKTSLTLGLARALARDGRTVLVVDGDPSPHGLTSLLALGNRPGWVNWSEDSVPASDLVVKNALGPVHLVTNGAQAPRRATHEDANAEVRTLKAVVDHLRGNYDVVLVDTADLGSHADVALTSRLADGAILVVPYDRVGPRELSRVKDSVTKVGGELVGTVLNFAARSARG